MLLTGKYEMYYSWMVYLPFCFLIFYSLDKAKDISKGIRYTIYSILFFGIGVGLPTKLFLYAIEYDKREYDVIAHFIEKNKVNVNNKSIYSDPHTYYAVKEKAKNLYIYYSLNYIKQPRIDSVSTIILNPKFTEIDQNTVFNKFGGKEKWIKIDSLRLVTNYNKNALNYDTDLYIKKK